MKAERIYFLIHSHTLIQGILHNLFQTPLLTYTVLFFLIVSIHRVHYNSIKIYISPYNTYLLPLDGKTTGLATKC